MNRQVVGIAAAVLAVVGGIGWLIAANMGAPVTQTKKLVQQVQIIRPTPPDTPPPPPPPEPEAAADEPPAGEQLGLDAEGVAGADGFGLLGRKGGRDLLAAGSGDQYGWYGQILKSDLIEQLAKIRDIRRDRYSIEVRLWLSADGRIQRFAIVDSTGDPELDRDLATAFESIDRVSETPPSGLPQPVRMRIVSRI